MNSIAFQLNGQIYYASTIADVGTLLAAGGVALDNTGNPYTVTPFDGGVLFNGLPLNVVLSGVWYAGQQAALAPAWQNGQLPQPVASVLNLPTTAVPASSSTAASTSAPGSTDDTTLWLAAAMLALLFL